MSNEDQYPKPDRATARCTGDKCPYYRPDGDCVATGEKVTAHCEPYVLWLVKRQKDSASKYFIPEIDPTDVEANELYRARIHGSIKPVIVRDGKLFYIEKPDSFNSFTYDPTVLGEATDIVWHQEIQTLHRCASYVFFKPSVDEVIRQLPENVDHIVAFSVKGPDSRTDMEKEWDSIEAGFHIATTTLYVKKKESL